MDFFVLIGQRYEGEYAPEALAVIDEYGNDDNPDYMRDELHKQTNSGDFSALAVMQLRVGDDAINKALFPAASSVAAEVVA